MVLKLRGTSITNLKLVPNNCKYMSYFNYKIFVNFRSHVCLFVFKNLLNLIVDKIFLYKLKSKECKIGIPP